MDNALTYILCFINAVIFGLVAALAAWRGFTGPGFQATLAIAVLFAGAGGLAWRGVLWPAVLVWFAAAFEFLWVTDRVHASFGLFDGGIVLFPFLIYLVGGGVGAIVTLFDARAARRALEKGRRG
jgi:hypothetical protein